MRGGGERIWPMLALLITAGCEPCLGEGQNGVPDPAIDEFQLVFNNIVAGPVELLVDGESAGTLCEESEYVTVGNFPAGTQTTILIQSRVGGDSCYVSPCCSSDCGAQSCAGSPVVDTTAFAGRVFVSGLIWDW